MAVEPRSHQPILPAAFATEAGELMLPYDMSGEPVRVRLRLLFSWRQNIDFAVSLLEGLHDVVVLQPASPAKNRLRIGLQRMP